MFFKKLISVATFVSLVFVLQSVLFNYGDSLSTKQLKYSFIAMPRRYNLERGTSGSGCCSGLRARLSRMLGSCFGCCCSRPKEEEEEVESPQGTYSLHLDIASGFRLHSGDLTLTCEGDGGKSTKRTQDDLRKLFASYGRFGCTSHDQTLACQELLKRIQHQTKKLNRKGLRCELVSGDVFSIG
ncbi:signal peptide protein [Cryptosporidium sp. chipmunk genotype I]|uniref:signal peptide protein n=1 Tax=Cryptosporidium sp. chipmunk genotype I TaxID=1280935 RepID=UPI00351A4F0B|nr:signal peptide protein [Cryptosporidium sp. chipmunk genotype I]